MLNDRVVPFYEEHGIPLLRILTDRGTEYCGNRDHHEYQLYLEVENIDHSKTKAYSPQTKAYASHCTSFEHSEMTDAAARRILSFLPCAFLGPSAPVGSYTYSGLSV